MSRAIPDGLKATAVNKYYRDSGGIQLSVYGVDSDTQTIELGTVRGYAIRYRWSERGDGGLRLVAVEGGAG